MSLKSQCFVCRTIRFVSSAAILGVLCGCQAMVSNPPLSQVRIITASPDAPGLDIYEANTAVTYNLGFGTTTSYIPFSPGNHTFTADTAGSRQVLTSSKTTLAPFAQYTILVGNVAAGMQQLTLTDQSQSAPTGQVSLRFIDQATRAGAVDVYLVPAAQKLTAVSPVITGVVFGTNTGYLNVPTGTYSLVILPGGTIPTSTTVPAYTGAQVTYSGGAARTAVLIDQQLPTAPGLEVIIANDFDPPSTTN